MKQTIRTKYLETLKNFRDHQVIKVITGIRRSGKSTLLQQYKNILLADGVKPSQIISINFEDFDYAELDNAKALYEYIKPKLNADKMNYLFFDEVQHVTDFQKAIDGLYVKPLTDIYITGSNATMLSGELATLLSGRYIEISILPLSFAEYYDVKKQNNKSAESIFAEYQRWGGLPYFIQMPHNEQMMREYLSGVYNTVVLKDIISRRSFNDTMMLESVIRFMCDNIGNTLSTKKIADTMNSGGRKTDVKTVERYLQALTESFVMYKTKRYDIKGRQYLKTLDKYYIVDLGIRHYLLGNKGGDSGHELENIVYLELLRRGNDIFIGKIGDKEVDFIAIGNDGTAYYQVSETVRDPNTLERELSSLRQINDAYPKYLLTMDSNAPIDHNGIRQINIIDWLLE